MELDELQEQASCCLALLCPGLQAQAPEIVRQCLVSARTAFRNEFILQLSPQAWARISLSYFTHFVDTGSDVSVGEMFATVMRDSIHLNRLDLLIQDLAQKKQAEVEERKRPSLSVVR